MQFYSRKLFWSGHLWCPFWLRFAHRVPYPVRLTLLNQYTSRRTFGSAAPFRPGRRPWPDRVYIVGGFAIAHQQFLGRFCNSFWQVWKKFERSKCEKPILCFQKVGYKNRRNEKRQKTHVKCSKTLWEIRCLLWAPRARARARACARTRAREDSRVFCSGFDIKSQRSSDSWRIIRKTLRATSVLPKDLRKSGIRRSRHLLHESSRVSYSREGDEIVGFLEDYT